jgi:hypothetical protein
MLVYFRGAGYLDIGEGGLPPTALSRVLFTPFNALNKTHAGHPDFL